MTIALLFGGAVAYKELVELDDETVYEIRSGHGHDRVLDTYDDGWATRASLGSSKLRIKVGIREHTFPAGGCWF